MNTVILAFPVMFGDWFLCCPDASLSTILNYYGVKYWSFDGSSCLIGIELDHLRCVIVQSPLQMLHKIVFDFKILLKALLLVFKCQVYQGTEDFFLKLRCLIPPPFSFQKFGHMGH